MPPSSPQPSLRPKTSLEASVSDDIDTVHERRLDSIIDTVKEWEDIGSWISTLGADGKWPHSEIDYTAGCSARRANWPAQTHWQRIITMSGAWHGGLKGAEQYVKDPHLRDAISSAMHFWFMNDFTSAACLDSGGTPGCPCETAGFWNTNWFSNVILIPRLVGESCLLLNDTLSAWELAACNHVTGRAYGAFAHEVNGVGQLTGANALDVAEIGITQGLLNLNVSLVAGAYRRVHEELVVRDVVKADGIRPDGSFGQHSGILYNGNYGKDYANDILDLEVEGSGTQFEANNDSKNAFATLISGDRWMIYRNVLTGVLHWDFSVLGRFISFPVTDDQATGSIKMNLSQIALLGHEWQSEVLINTAEGLSKDTTNANAGNLTGNRMFYDNDYMVHRGANYVTTVKMYSSRTKNTECTNSQNPFGFHLADGVVHTYLDGNEYEDIAAAWDWDLIPGTTVDYRATPLTCENTEFTGIEAFVGGASDGQVGVAAMRYTNPYTKSLSWQKAWFFLENDVQHVMISNVTSTNKSVPVFSVLDQRRRAQIITVDGVEKSKQTTATTYPTATSLWHGSVGYTFPTSNGSFELSLKTGEQSGEWSSIGTSSQPPTTVNLFASWLEHKSINDSVSYTAFPGVSLSQFASKSRSTSLWSLQNDAHVSAVYDRNHVTVMVVFWDLMGGKITFTPTSSDASITISSQSNAIIIYKLDTGNVVASDPSQKLRGLKVALDVVGSGRKPPCWGADRSKNLAFTLPKAGLTGRSTICQNPHDF